MRQGLGQPAPSAPGPDSCSTDHETGKKKRVRRTPIPEGWVPFGNAPLGIRRRFGGYLKVCHRKPETAIRLFCVECLGYSTKQAGTCEALTCVFYPYNRRFFGGEK